MVLPFTAADLAAARSGLKRARGYYDKGMSYYRQAKRVKRMVGEAVGSSTAEATFLNTNSDALVATRALISTPLIRVERDKGTYDKRKRMRDILDIRGVKWCFTIVNRTDEDLTMHYAIVKRKDGTTPNGTEFLGDIGGPNRACSVAEVGYSDHHLDCLPVSTDDYKILTHKKFLLNADTRTAATGILNPAQNRRNYVHRERYIKINRQMRFVEGAVNPIDNLYICWWGYRRGRSTVAAQLDAWSLEQDLTCYFRSLI